MKEIMMRTLNKVKELDLKIFDYEDDEPEYVNRRGVAACERAINKALKDYNEEEKRELLQNIHWYNDNCTIELQMRGWKVI